MKKTIQIIWITSLVALLSACSSPKSSGIAASCEKFLDAFDSYRTRIAQFAPENEVGSRESLEQEIRKHSLEDQERECTEMHKKMGVLFLIR